MAGRWVGGCVWLCMCVCARVCVCVCECEQDWAGVRGLVGVAEVGWAGLAGYYVNYKEEREGGR